MREEGSISHIEPDEAAKLIRKILVGVLAQAEGSQGQAFRSEKFLRFMAFLEPHLIPDMDLASGAAVTNVLNTIDDELLVSGFPDEIVWGLDSIIPVVLHTIRPPYPGKVDWEWLKAGVKALYEGGDHCPAVIFSQNGTVGSGRLLEPFRLVSPISDPEQEVYVIDESSALSIAIKMTWDEVREFHVRRSQGYSHPSSDNGV